MAMTLYELATAADARPSPFCWRVRLALAHKGVGAAIVPLRFTQIRSVGGGAFRTVPILDAGGTLLGGSRAIVDYLEGAVPAAPSLYPEDPRRQFADFVEGWVDSVLLGQVFSMVALDVWSALTPDDQVYFRASREARLGRTLESCQSGREDRIDPFRASLEPARRALTRGPFLCGERSGYADYALFGALQWPRIVSRLPLLAEADPLMQWFERCLDLFGGGGRAALRVGM